MATTTALNPIETLILRKIEEAARVSPLVSIMLLRQQAGVTRRKFDDAVLALVRFGYLSLYRSDLPKRLMTDYEREGMLWWGETAYNGCSIRRS